MEFNGTVKEISGDILTGKTRVVLETDIPPGVLACEYEKLRRYDMLRVKIERCKKKRSIDANAYCWVLCTRLAEKLNSSKDSVYKEMVLRYGSIMTDENDNMVILSTPLKLDEVMLDLHVKYIGTLQAKDGALNQYLVIKGSSQSDTKEMATLIDGIVSECKELGIETLTPDEIERMCAAWQG